LAVTASQCFLDKYSNSKVIVIAPKSLISNFKKEILAYGSKIDPSKYVFYSFEKFANQPMKERTFNCSNNMLIVDEAHILRTAYKKAGYLVGEGYEEEEDIGFGNRAQKILSCAIKAKKVLLLTATPFINQSYDAANLVAMVKGEKPLALDLWKSMRDGAIKEYFKDAFSYYSVPKTKANKYPEVNIHEEYLEMDWTFYEKYKKIEKRDGEILHQYLIGQVPEAFLMGFRTALLRIEDSAKINFAMNKIAETIYESKKEKIVIYSSFVSAGIKKIGNLLEDEKISYATITGELSETNRQQAIDAYNSGKVRVLLISKAGGVGIDLKKTTRMVILDIAWNQATIEQAIGRAARYQSHTSLKPEKQKVDVYILYSIKPSAVNMDLEEKPSVDIILKSIIDRKLEEEEEFMRHVFWSSEHLSLSKKKSSSPPPPPPRSSSRKKSSSPPPPPPRSSSWKKSSSPPPPPPRSSSRKKSSSPPPPPPRSSSRKKSSSPPPPPPRSSSRKKSSSPPPPPPRSSSRKM
jgi:superfamily II DNA or RNA helicase